MNYVVFNDPNYPAVREKSWRLIIFEGTTKVALSKGFDYEEYVLLHKIGKHIVENNIFLNKDDFNDIVSTVVKEKSIQILDMYSIPVRYLGSVPCGNPLTRE